MKVTRKKKTGRTTRPQVVQYKIRIPGYPPGFHCPDIKPSAAEKLIITELKKWDTLWHREVSFDCFMSSRFGHFRFDFFLPALRLMIEYDGKLWHSDPGAQAKDKDKTTFCTKYGMTVIRLNAKDYYKMESRIAEIMKTHGVPLARK